MSWKNVGIALRALTPTGSQGFEGVVARILEKLTEMRFILARSGDQPSGDALGTDCTTVLQAKRYREDTSLNENEIVGDIERVLHEVADVEVYVLAVTRTVAQIRSRLSRVADSTNLDIVYLSYEEPDTDGAPPDLGALCAIFWNDISSLAVKGGPKKDPQSLSAHFASHDVSEEWLLRKASGNDVKEIGERIRKEIVERLQTFGQFQSQSIAHLAKRFGFSNAPTSRFPYPIRLQEIVKRSTSIESLRNWWASEASRVSYIEGEEGVGKSWIAADFTWSLANEPEVLCLWLDSIGWAGCRTLEEAIQLAARTTISNSRITERIVKKLLNRWNKPILVVLDGVNERNAIEAARRILSDFCDCDKGPENIRLLFTTRPLEGYSHYSHQLWEACKKIKCQGFDDVELEEALFRHNLKPGDLPESIKDVVRLPRYFNLCLNLRERLGTLDHVSKELLLWEDLKRKIEQTDTQVYDKLGFRSIGDAEEVLARLAQQATIHAITGHVDLSADLLSNCFGSDYDSIRIDLQEQRFSQQSRKFSAHVNQHHVILGWALQLRALVSASPNSDIDEAIDILREALEPIPSDDWRTEGLYVAYSLIIADQEDLCNSAIRAALLSAWYDSHNLVYLSGRIRAIAEKDLEAYVKFVEKMFERIQFAREEVTLIEPLARMWQSELHVSDLEQVLERWLLLAWHPELSPSESEIIFEGIKVPTARNETQLRLSAAAISILSQRADSGFLLTFVKVLHTLPASKSTIVPHAFSAKHCDDNIGFLMRWSYTEESLGALVDLAKDHNASAEIVDGVQRLAASLRVANLPLELQRPPLPSGGGASIYMDVENALRNGQTVFEIDAARLVGKPIKISEHAVRQDFPKPGVEDLQVMRDALQLAIQDHFPHSSAEGPNVENWTMDSFLPWVARYFPTDFSCVMARCAFKSLEYENPFTLLHEINAFVPNWSDDSQNEFLRCGKQWLDKLSTVDKKEFRGLRVVPNLLTELIALGCSSELLCDWLCCAAMYPGLRDSLLWNSIPKILSALEPDGLLELARAQSKAIGADSEGELSHAGYWIYIWTCVTPRDSETYEWAKSQLLLGPPSEEEWASLVGLLAESCPENIWNCISSDVALQKVLARNRARCHRLLAFHAREAPSEVKEVNGLIRAGIPTGFIGQILVSNGDIDGLGHWADELWNSVSGLMGIDLGLEMPLSRVAVQIDSENGLPRYGAEQNLSWSVHLGSSTGFWGKDSKGFRDLKEAMSFRPDHSGQVLDSISRIEDVDNLGVLQFGNPLPLTVWAKRNPKVLANLAERYFESLLDDPMLQLKFGAFTDTVISALVSVDPARAFGYWCDIEESDVKTNARGISGAPTFAEEIWSRDLNSSPDIQDVRRQFFERCGDDEKIMSSTCGALSVGNRDELVSLCRNSFLTAYVARERCLAVSILPWITDQDTIGMLQELSTTDPSLWVRKHAAWAVETARSEWSCMHIYREALAQPCAENMSALLHCMKPALLPSARWWRRCIESESDFRNSCSDPYKKAIIASFWLHWDCSSGSKNGTKIAGRKLSEFCRGDKLDPNRTERLWPWWKV